MLVRREKQPHIRRIGSLTGQGNETSVRGSYRYEKSDQPGISLGEMCRMFCRSRAAIAGSSWRGRVQMAVERFEPI